MQNTSNYRSTDIGIVIVLWINAQYSLKINQIYKNLYKINHEEYLHNFAFLKAFLHLTEGQVFFIISSAFLSWISFVLAFLISIWYSWRSIRWLSIFRCESAGRSSQSWRHRWAFDTVKFVSLWAKNENKKLEVHPIINAISKKELTVAYCSVSGCNGNAPYASIWRPQANQKVDEHSSCVSLCIQ